MSSATQRRPLRAHGQGDEGGTPARGLNALRWHDLRRTCGCRLLQDHGLSMEGVKEWLGHHSVTVTEKAYAFLEIEDLHRAVQKSAGAAQKSAQG
jgi:integrase